MTAAHAEIVERLEKATGPDEEIDEDIALLLGWEQRGWSIESANLGWFAPGVQNVMHVNPPAFTASLDAALTLVPENRIVGNLCEWHHSDLRSMGKWLCVLNLRGNNPPPEFGARCQHAPSAALALCIAALKAIGEK